MPEGRNDWTTVLSHLAGEIEVAPLISHVAPLAEGAGIFSRILGRMEFFNKVLLVP